MQKHKTIETFLDSLEPNKKEIVEFARQIILETNSHLQENIKWNAPNYNLNWIDRITFNIFGKDNVVKIVLHFGTSIKEDKTKKAVYEKHSNLIVWASNIRGYIKIESLDFIKNNSLELKEIFTDWLKISL